MKPVQRSLSLQRRLIFLLLLVGLIPLLVVAMLNNLQSARTLSELANSQLAELAVSSADQIEHELFDYSGNVEAFANSDAARALDPLRITPMMVRMTSIYQPHYRLMLVANAQGEIIAASSARSDGSYLDGVRVVGQPVAAEEWFAVWETRRIKAGNVFIGPVHAEPMVAQLYEDAGYVVALSHGIFNQAGSLIGVWVTFVDWEFSQALLATAAEVPDRRDAQTIGLTLLDQHGLVLSSSTGSPPLQRSYTPPDDMLVQEAVVNYEADPQVNLGWTIVATQARSEALATARRQTLQTLLGAIGLGVLAVVIGILVTRVITQPLAALKDGAEAVAKGNLRVHVPEGPGEIGMVAQAFNLMTTQLSGLYANLEEQVTQRTAELESTLTHLRQRTTELQLSQQQLSATNTTLADSESRYRSLFERTQDMLHETQVLYRIAQALIQSDSLATILQHAVDGAVEALDAYAVVLMTFDRRSREITSFVRGGVGSDVIDVLSYAELEEGLSGWVMRHEKPALSPGGAADPRESAAAYARRKQQSVGSIVVTPLLYRNRLLGTVTALNLLDQRVLTPYDVEILVTISHQAAVAIQNAHLYAAAQQELAERRRAEEELRSYQEQLEEQVQQRTSELAQTAAELTAANLRLREDVALARDIQMGLLPTRPPWDSRVIEVAGRSLAAAEVGGDFYTYLPTAHVGGMVAIGDISGKGVGAALMMALVMSALENEATLFADPALLINRLQRLLRTRLQRNRMNAAVCLVDVDLEQRYIRVVNAGMIAPLLVRQSSVEYLDVGGFPVGTSLGEYKALRLPLQADDLLVLVSDGVVEAHNDAGELYGFERLQACVLNAPRHGAPSEIVDHILSDVLLFTQATPQHDDLTLVVLRPRIPAQAADVISKPPSDIVHG